MSKIDELFDGILYKAKSVADVAGKKTGDVVNFSKLKYQVKQTQWDIEKSYAKLGAFVYESKKSAEDFTDLIDLAVNEIDLLCEKLENLEQQILACRKVIKCSGCGKENELTNSYCARCGSSLEDDRRRAEQEDYEAEAAEVAEAMDEARKTAETEENKDGE